MCKNGQKQIKRNGGNFCFEPKRINKTCACEISEHRKIQSVDELENCLKLVIARAFLIFTTQPKDKCRIVGPGDQKPADISHSDWKKNESCKSCWRFFAPIPGKNHSARRLASSRRLARPLTARSVLLRAQTHINIHHLLAGARKKHTHTHTHRQFYERWLFQKR